MSFLKNTGLTIVLLILFTLTIGGHFLAGHKAYNEDREMENQPPVSRSEYVHSGHFISSVAENMESEFLQMAFFAYLTMCLYQKGSAESKKLPKEMTAEDLKKEMEEKSYSARKAKAHPILWRVYENSLSLALLLLFIISFFIHGHGSRLLINEEHARAGKPLIDYWSVFSEGEYWFESFQNWQSEFFSVAAMVLLTIFLRQKGSSQSKKMNDSNWKTGSD